MEDRIRALEITQAVQDEKILRLTETIETNTAALETLNETLAKFKGAWGAVLIISCFIGFITSSLADFIQKVFK